MVCRMTVPRHRERPPFSGLKRNHYGVIYADPPWKFSTYSPKGIGHRSAEQHYRTQDLEWLKSLPVESLAAKDCVLFMWVVDSHLDVAMDVLAAWGFKYMTRGLVWVKTKKSDPTKPRMGMGYWTRKESELCILATRGKPHRVSKGVRQVIMEPRREHSRKPDTAYERIEQLVDGPYVELFARQRKEGWDAWGDDVDKFGTV